MRVDFDDIAPFVTILVVIVMFAIVVFTVESNDHIEVMEKIAAQREAVSTTERVANRIIDKVWQ